MTARRQRPLSREEYARGLPDYHDPTAGWAGAAPMYSALTLRLWVSGIGILFCVATGIVALRMDGWLWFALVLFAVALGLLINIGWVAHRKRRGEPG
ncbi:hypothetical protein H0B56_19610 [Haloechinothrix sp. YIM 98757]|uniref:DUF2530 domain-containing protein n=1 Tax=Haloechinothrix aidingensis TaxID=2752311 RepID=A0A838AF55_9PSEU|nr:hypothetical protein [Haloechinothrix aidingensis]MBA0127758.1 hypothetical protein [Haloechinothrix aidingensis]